VKLVLKILLGVAFILGGINHFINPAFYVKMMPGYIPLHHAMVILSGVTEIAVGVMLLIPATSRLGAWGIIAHLLVFLTVHIWMLQKADTLYKDLPVGALWGRLAFQFVFIAWAYWFTKQDPPPQSSQH
jgi:uncharacterized membrane protein